MVVSAAHFKDLTNGYERTTDGLWVHRGRFSAGPPGAAVGRAGDINANRGDGTGVYYFAGKGDRYLYYDGAKFVFSPPLGTSAIAPGSAQQLIGQYFATNGWAAAQATAWLETSVQVSGTFTNAGLVRIEFSTNVQSPGPSLAVIYIGVGIDGGVTFPSLQIAHVPASYSVPMSGCIYSSPLSGSHRISLFMYAGQAGCALVGSGYSYLAVTEQRL